MRKSRKVTSNICEIIDRKKIDLLLIQEPYCNNNYISGFTSKSKIFCNGEGRKRAAVVILNNNIDSVLISDLSNEDFVLVEITIKNNNFWVLSAYFDATKNIDDDISKLEEIINFINGKPFLIAVDSNARSTMWHDIITNHRGSQLENFIIQENLILLNEDIDQPTFQTRTSQSSIDLTIVNLSMVKFCSDWRIGTEESGSDHQLISYKLFPHTDINDNERESLVKSYNYYKADWNLFIEKLTNFFCRLFNFNSDSSLEITSEKLDKILSGKLFNITNFDQFIGKYIRSIQKAANIAIPIRKSSNNVNVKKTVCWWTKDLTELRKQVNSKRRKFQRTYNNQILRESRRKEYFDLRHTYLELIKETKMESWKEFCSQTTKSNPWNCNYKNAAGKLRTQSTFSTLKKSDGSFTTTLEETLNLLMDKFIPEDDPKDDTPFNDFVRNVSTKQTYVQSTASNDTPFSIKEIENTISTFKTGKTPGDDGIGIEIISQVFNSFPHFVTAIYNECFRRSVFPSIWKIATIISVVKPGKESDMTVEKFRPISLLPTSGKLLEKLLINRIIHYLNTNQLLSDRQYGFTCQKNTTDAIMKVKEYIEDSLKERLDVLLITLDVKGAFDAAWWPAILLALRDFNCPKNLYDLTTSYFTNRYAKLRTKNIIINRKVTRGCPQGSCSAPGYWNIQYDTLLKLNFPGDTTWLAFADDFIILARAKDPLELELLGNRCTSLIENWSLKSKVQFNSKKTKVMHITRKRAKPELSIFLNNEKLELVKEIKYLGVIINSNFKWNAHIEYICSKSLQIINKLSRSAKVYWGISSEALEIIYKGAFLPFLTYAAPVWYNAAEIQANKQKLIRVQRLILLRIIKGFKTISFEAACIIANIEPIFLSIEKIAKQYLIERGLLKTINNTHFEIEKPVNPSFWNHPAKLTNIDNKKNITNSLSIYTDGSKSEEGVGCSFVVYYTGTIIKEGKFRLNEKCSNNQAEQLAIFKSLEWIELCAGGVIRAGDTITIHTDSRISIDCVNNHCNHLPLIENIRKKLIHITNTKKISIYISWVRAHVGTEGNERADMLAKEASKDLTLPEIYQQLSKTVIKTILDTEAVQKWQALWAVSSKGTYTKDYFPDVPTRAKTNLPLNYYTTQALSGHGKNRAYLHRFTIINDPSCLCDGKTPQTWDHIIFDCNIFNQQRMPLLRQFVLNGIGWTKDNKSYLIHKDFIHFFQVFLRNLNLDTL